MQFEIIAAACEKNLSEADNEVRRLAKEFGISLEDPLTIDRLAGTFAYIVDPESEDGKKYANAPTEEQIVAVTIGLCGLHQYYRRESDIEKMIGNVGSVWMKIGLLTALLTWRQSDKSRESRLLSSIGKKAANAKHAKTRKSKDEAIRWWSENKDKLIKPRNMKEAARQIYEWPEMDGLTQDTIWGWIREHEKSRK